MQWDSSPRTIVELGGGTGPMTRALISRKGETACLTSCELDTDRYNGLKHLESKSIKIVHLDAEKCLEAFVSGSVDLVVSTLPLGSMPPVHAREILRAAASALSPEGRYIQYQYFATNKKDVEEFFYHGESRLGSHELPTSFHIYL